MHGWNIGGGGQWACRWRALAEKSNLNSMHLKQDRTQQIRKENMRFKAYGKYGNETNFVVGFYWYLNEIHLLFVLFVS